MDRNRQRHFIVSEQGVTLAELLVAIMVLLIVATISIPAFAQWRQNLESRRVARSIVQLLREARATAISFNREHRVEFEPKKQRFGLRAGNRTVDTNWPEVPPVSNWIACSPEVELSANITSVQFNTNGTANGGKISVRNGNMQHGYDIIVARTGRIRIK